MLWTDHAVETRVHVNLIYFLDMNMIYDLFDMIYFLDMFWTCCGQITQLKHVFT